MQNLSDNIYPKIVFITISILKYFITVTQPETVFKTYTRV